MQIIENGQRSYFANLFKMALADNRIDPQELAFLHELGIKRGFSKEQIDEIIADPNKVPFEKPKSTIEVIEQLYDLVQMVLKDGKVHHQEISLCKSFAKRFDIREEIIDDLIENLIEKVRNGISMEVLSNEIKQII